MIQTRNKIAINGIGTMKKDKPEKNPEDFMSIKEYELACRKMITAYCSKSKPGLAKRLLDNDDLISNIMYHMMVADWEYDGTTGTQHGFRKSRVEFAIRRFLSKGFNNGGPEVFSFDSINGISNKPFVENMESSDECPRTIMSNKETKIKFQNMLKEMLDKRVITPLGYKYVTAHYFDGLSIVDIAKKNSVTRQGVSSTIKRSTKSIGKIYNIEDFLEV